MKKILLAGLFLVMGITLFAQSRIVHMGMSAILPGSGEIALGKVNRGAIRTTLDILTLTAYYQTGKERDNLKDSYVAFAQNYAGVTQSGNERYYQYLQDYQSSADFNQYQEMMARNYFLVYNYDPDAYTQYMEANTFGSDEAWKWESNADWNKYKSIRTRHQHAKINNNLALGVLIFNRAVSVLDVNFIIRNQHRASPVMGSFYLEPSGGDGLKLNCQLDF